MCESETASPFPSAARPPSVAPVGVRSGVIPSSFHHASSVLQHTWPRAPAGATEAGGAGRASDQRFNGTTGMTVRPNVLFVTAANHAYQATAAVARPTQPPILVTFSCAPASPMPSRKNVTDSSAKTVAIAAVVRKDATSMYVVKMPHAIRY